MPISLTCPCGKGLRVADEYAGRRVKCPVCQAVSSVPAPEPVFEVVEAVDEPPAPPPPPVPVPARPVAKPARRRAGENDDDDDDRGYGAARKGREDDEPREKKKPNFRRSSSDDEDDDRPRKRKKRPPEQTNRSFEGRIFHGGPLIGILAMIGGAVWLVVGLMNDLLFPYSIVLFIIGLVAFFKGLISKE